MCAGTGRGGVTWPFVSSGLTTSRRTAPAETRPEDRVRPRTAGEQGYRDTRAESSVSHAPAVASSSRRLPSKQLPYGAHGQQAWKQESPPCQCDSYELHHLTARDAKAAPRHRGEDTCRGDTPRLQGRGRCSSRLCGHWGAAAERRHITVAAAPQAWRIWRGRALLERLPRGRGKERARRAPYAPCTPPALAAVLVVVWVVVPAVRGGAKQ
jgi:hypothetical protein